MDPLIWSVFAVGFYQPAPFVDGRCRDLGFEVVGIAEVIIDSSSLFSEYNPTLGEAVEKVSKLDGALLENPLPEGGFMLVQTVYRT